MEGSLSTTIEAKRKIIVVKGPRVRAPSSNVTSGVDFEQYAKDGGFERILEDMQSGRIPSDKYNMSDSHGNGLRIQIRKTGVMTFYCQYRAPQQREDMAEFDEDDAPTTSRPTAKVGFWPKTSVKMARHRAEAITTLARNGIDWRWHKVGAFRELDRVGAKWKP